MSTARVTLDSPVFAGRLRQFSRGTPFVHAPTRAPQPVQPRGISDIYQAPSEQQEDSRPLGGTLPAMAARPSRAASAPALPRQDRSQVLQRNIGPLPAAAKKRRRRLALPGSQRVMMAMASVVFVAGLAVAVQGLLTNKAVVSQVRQGNAVNGASTDDLSEDKPSATALANYRTDPSLPRYVRIASQNVFARVQRQGLDKAGALKAPANVHDAGWYENSSKPGEAGAMLLDGHVAGPTQRGVFYNIKNLKPGDLIEIERGDGQKFTYKVVKSVVSDANKTDMAAALTPVTAGKAGLNLMTCTGQYNHKTGDYDQRVTVFAQQV